MILRLEAACNNHCRVCTGRLPPGTIVSPSKTSLAVSVSSAPLPGEADGGKSQGKGREVTLLRGREPTMVDDLLSLLNRVGPLELYSNARRFAYEHFTRRLASYLERVVVSVHGATSSVHDWFTTTPGSFDQTIRGIANLGRLAIPVTVRVVLGRHNLADLDRIVDLAERMGADRIRFVWLSAGLVEQASADGDSSLAVTTAVAGPFLAAALRRAWRVGLETELAGLSGRDLFGLSPRELHDIVEVQTEPLADPEVEQSRPGRDDGPLVPPRLDPAGAGVDRAAPAWFDEETDRIRAVVRTTCENACQFCTTRILHEEAGRLWPQDRTGDFLSQLVSGLGPWRKRLGDGAEGIAVRLVAIEPAEHPDIDIMVAAAAHWTGARVQIDSSGRRFADEAFASRLVDLGLGGVDLLLLGPNEGIHDLVAGSKGAFEELERGIRNLVGRVELTGHVVLVRDNADSVIETVKWAKSLGLDVTHVSFAAPASLNPAHYEKVAVFLPAWVSRMEDAGADGLEVLGLARAELPPCLLPLSVGGARIDSARQPVRLTHPEDFSVGVKLKERSVCPLAEGCALAARCPGLFSQYVELFGIEGLKPVR